MAGREGLSWTNEVSFGRKRYCPATEARQKEL
nr:MAG TPA: hypothetical protein [Caudoviricetes sp.]